jgi:hypothetical protein
MSFLNVLLFLLLLSFSSTVYAQRKAIDTSEAMASKVQALAYIDSAKDLPQSIFWTHVNPQDFLENIKRNVQHPLQLSTGRGTNFCAYGALSYTCLKNEPLRYVQCMLDLYKNGEAKYRNIRFKPSKAIFKAAGQIIFSGDLDKNHADQIWYLSLAHKFKGYVNWLHWRYKPGAENTFWAACNLAKFNRMLRRMCKYKVRSKGSDLIQPHIENLVAYLQHKLTVGEVYLYLNNAILRKKNHNEFKRMVPTHFVVLYNIHWNEENGKIVMEYWDGDYKTIKELELPTLEKIVYGISWTKYAKKNEE